MPMVEEGFLLIFIDILFNIKREPVLRKYINCANSKMGVVFTSSTNITRRVVCSIPIYTTKILVAIYLDSGSINACLSSSSI